MTAEIDLYFNNYAAWAEKRAPIRVELIRKAEDAEALSLWRVCRDEMRAAMWALMDAELRERIRRLARETA